MIQPQTERVRPNISWVTLGHPTERARLLLRVTTKKVRNRNAWKTGVSEMELLSKSCVSVRKVEPRCYIRSQNQLRGVGVLPFEKNLQKKMQRMRPE